MTGWKDKLALTVQKNRQEIVKAKLSRRENDAPRAVDQRWRTGREGGSQCQGAPMTVA